MNDEFCYMQVNHTKWIRDLVIKKFACLGDNLKIDEKID